MKMNTTNFISQYRILNKIGEGSFGTVYQASKDHQLYALKTENIANVKSMLGLEFQIYQELFRSLSEEKHESRGYGFPKVFQYQEKEHFSYLCMEKLDSTLQDVINFQLKNLIPKDVILSIMFNTLSTLYQLHELGYVYRDIKPANFMLKKLSPQILNDQKNKYDGYNGKIYLIDLGLCKKYLKKDSQSHIPMKVDKKMIGTPLFCSANTHQGFEISRRDDIQSWIYMIIYLVKKLPWEKYALPAINKKEETIQKEIWTKQESYLKIKAIKQETNILQLIKEGNLLPRCLQKFYEIVKEMEFQNRPNYQYFFSLIQKQYEELTNCERKLSEMPFSLTSRMNKKVEEKSKNIKINFKIPTNKIKQQKQVNMTEIDKLMTL